MNHLHSYENSTKGMLIASFCNFENGYDVLIQDLEALQCCF